jgi:hypothetical protein
MWKKPKKYRKEKLKEKRDILNPKERGFKSGGGKWKGTFYKKNKITKQTKHTIGVI